MIIFTFIRRYISINIIRIFIVKELLLTFIQIALATPTNIKATVVIFDLAEVKGVFGNSWLAITLKCINHGLGISLMLVYGLKVIKRSDIDLT